MIPTGGQTGDSVFLATRLPPQPGRVGRADVSRWLARSALGLVVGAWLAERRAAAAQRAVHAARADELLESA